MKSEKFDPKHIRHITDILERKLDYKKNVHLIDIYPKHENYDIFFTNSFTMNPKKTSLMVKAGYKRTLEVFKHHEFES